MFSSQNPLFRQYKIILTANLVIICVGMSIGWMSPIIVKLRSEDTVLSRPVTDSEVSWIVSASSFSNIFSNFFAGYLVDRIGRKKTLILSWVPKIIACLTYIFAKEVWMLYMARVFDGMSESIGMVVVPLYAAEIADKEIRGALGSMLQICSSIGVVTVLSIGPYVSYFTMNFIYISMSIIFAILTLFLIDSPFYLYKKGQHDEAKKLLVYLRGSENAAKEEIIHYSSNNQDCTIDKLQLLKDKIVLKALVFVAIFGFGIQFTGFNAVSHYLQTILESTQTSVKPEVASVIVGAIQLFASVCTSLFADNFGRKPILISTLLGVTVGMAGVGAFFHLKDNNYDIVGFLNYLPILSLIIIVFCYSGGAGSIFWLIIPELFEGPARGVGISVALFSTNIAMFLVTKFFPALTIVLGTAITFWIFAGFCMFLAMFILVFIPETKKKSFVEIQKALGRRGLDGFCEKTCESKIKY